jgi:hypothetical protein
MKRSLLYKALRDEALIKLPYLKFRDLQKGQMQNPVQNYPVPLPALFIEIGDADFSQLSEAHQKGDLIISLYLYLDCVTDSFDGAEREEETIDLLDKMDDVFQAFEGFSIYGITPLVRKKEHKPQYGKRFIMYRIDFSSTVDSHKILDKNKMNSPKVEFEGKSKFKFKK